MELWPPSGRFDSLLGDAGQERHRSAVRASWRGCASRRGRHRAWSSETDRKPMTGLVEPLGRPVDTVVSPELALVDPSLAELERARPRLPSPGARVLPHLTWAQDRRDVRTRSLWLRERVAHLWARVVLVARRRSILGASLALGVVVLSIVVLENTIHGGGSTPQGSASETPLVLPTTSGTTHLTTRPVTRSDRKHTTGVPRRFAWAPVAGSDSYHVELFRDSERVFSADSKGPTILVPRRWTYRGRTRTLAPGRYQWYVWSKVSGKRSTTAIVQARLDVPSA
jgi:hypothetical protein